MSSIADAICMEHDGANGRAPFCVGDTVVVTRGVADPDFPDVHLDGRAGTVIEVDRKTSPTRYLLEWNESALESFPRRCRDRCESEDMVFGQMWLFEDDLTPLAV